MTIAVSYGQKNYLGNLFFTVHFFAESGPPKLVYWGKEAADMLLYQNKTALIVVGAIVQAPGMNSFSYPVVAVIPR